MSKKISCVKRIVAIVDICCLVVLTVMSLIKGANINMSFFFNVLLCFLFSGLLFTCAYCNDAEAREINNRNKMWVYFLLFSGVILSIVEIYMFYEEMVKGRSGISCAIAGIATYTLFDSAHKYLIRKE